MARQTGYKRVAAIKGNRVPYLYYALYDDEIKSGDSVLVSGCNQGRILTVDHIFLASQLSNVFDRRLTEEVVCKVDISKYKNRLDTRKLEEKEQRLKILQAKIKCVCEEHKRLFTEYVALMNEK